MPDARAQRLLAATVLLTALVAGCGGGALGDAVAPSTAAGSSGELPWPADGAADAGALQADVDAGTQPWLLDPVEVSLSYAAAVHDWQGAQASPRSAQPDGSVVVEIRDGSGDTMALTLRQPSRAGEGGIWVITSEHRG